MNEQEQLKHNADIEVILFLMEEHGIKQVYKTNENSAEFLYFDDIKD